MSTVGQLVRLDRAGTSSKVGIINTAFKVTYSDASIVTGEFKHHRVRFSIAAVSYSTLITIDCGIDSCSGRYCVYAPAKRCRSEIHVSDAVFSSDFKDMITVLQSVRAKLDRAGTGSKVGIIYTAFKLLYSHSFIFTTTSIISGEFKGYRV